MISLVNKFADEAEALVSPGISGYLKLCMLIPIPFQQKKCTYILKYQVKQILVLSISRRLCMHMHNEFEYLFSISSPSHVFPVFSIKVNH